MELLALWTVALALAAAYAWARRRAAAGSPPRPPAGSDPLELRARVTIGSWSSDDGYSQHLRVDDRHLVLELGRQRAVVARADVTALVDRGLLGWRVDSTGGQRLAFSVPRRDRALLHDHLRRHGWPVVPG